MALLRKRTKADASIAVSNEDGMAQFLVLKNKLHDSIDAVDKALDHSRDKRDTDKNLADAWATRVMEVNNIKTDNPNAQRALSILLREAESRAAYHKEATGQHSEAVDLLTGQLAELKTTMTNMDEYQRNFELEKRLKQISVSGPMSTAPSSIDFDIKEISRLVHTANALVELKERK